ncbi:MAG TPA: hypothetical protein VEO20_00945 [Thermoplasmata archaeon]|nr:hypothetical protein [Thermoplasmata archaeon]
MSSLRHVESGPDGIDLLIHRADGSKTERRYVVRAHLEPLNALDVDGGLYYHVKIDDVETTVQADELFEKLRREGKVLSRRDVEDSVSAVLEHATRGKIVKGHAALGIYVRPDGTFEFCERPHTLFAEQENAYRNATAALACVATKEMTQAYLAFAAKLHIYESYPAMGLGAIGPFAYPLRQRGVLVPHLYAWGPPGLGKSAVNRAYSSKLYGRLEEAADDLGSRFRFAAIMAAAGTPVCVEECEMFEPKMGPALKVSAERPITDKRGQQDLGMVTYPSLSTLLMSGNTIPFSAPSVLVRIIAPRFDATAVGRRHAKDVRQVFDALFASLQAIGFDLLRSSLKRFPTIGSLEAEIQRLRIEIEDAYTLPFSDPRRALAHAVVLVGLGMWGDFARSKGLEWTAPSPPDYVRSMVRPIEVSTTEGSVEAVEKLVSWFKLWRVRNTVGGIVRGQDEVWLQGDLGPVRGAWIGRAILDDYNGSTSPEYQISSLAELGRQSARRFGLKLEDVAGSDGRGVVKKWMAGNVRAVFVSDEELSAEEAKVASAPVLVPSAVPSNWGDEL